MGSWLLNGRSIVIDNDGYRPNVGIILCNDQADVLWCRRIGQDAWQFPQGGIKFNETPESAMYRELHEEIGLRAEHVTLMGSTQAWLQYDLPAHLIRKHSEPLCIGQKQIWFMLHLPSQHEQQLRMDRSSNPEFDHWQWVNYWHPVDNIIDFKRNVYKLALEELQPLLTRLPSSPS